MTENKITEHVHLFIKDSLITLLATLLKEFFIIMTEVLANINLNPASFKPDFDGYLMKQSIFIIHFNYYF